MRICLDVDGVLADFIGGLASRFPGLTEEHFPEFDLQHTTGHIPASCLFEAMAEPGFYRSLLWYPGALERTQRFLREGHEVAFVTDVVRISKTAAYERVTWLRRQFPDVPCILAGAKHLVRGDVLIDDALHNVRPWLAEGRRALLIDRPWSRGRDIPVHNYATLEIP